MEWLDRGLGGTDVDRLVEDSPRSLAANRRTALDEEEERYLLDEAIEREMAREDELKRLKSMRSRELEAYWAAVVEGDMEPPERIDK